MHSDSLLLEAAVAQLIMDNVHGHAMMCMVAQRQTGGQQALRMNLLVGRVPVPGRA